MKTHSYNSIKLLLKTIPFYHFFKKAESWSRDHLEAFQLKKLQDITEYAYKHVPYYRDTYKMIGFLPGDIKSFADFKKLPCLKKEILRNNPPEIFYSDENKLLNVSFVRTSGSTGIPLAFACDIGSVAAKYAITYRALFAAGYKIGDIQLIIKNFPKLETACCYERIPRQLYMHAYRLNKAGIDELIPFLKKYPPKHILAHPSELLELGIYLNNSKEYFPRLKSITSFAEVLYPALRQRLQDTFSCPVFDYYSNKESSLVAYEVENHEFIMGEHFCFPEINNQNLDDKNKCSENAGELISTTFFSYAMPLIRYCNADIVNLREPTDNDTIKFLHVKEVNGRMTEKIKLPSGISVGINNIMKANLENIIMYQFVQTKKDLLEIHYLPSFPGAIVHKDEILNEIKSYVGSEMNVIIKEVSNLQKTQGGKTLRVIGLKEE